MAQGRKRWADQKSEEAKKSCLARLFQMRYTSNDKLKSGLPLGGIGAGKLEILPNGGLDFFTVANNFDAPITDNPHRDKDKRSIAYGLIGQLFAVSVEPKPSPTRRKDGRRIARLLTTTPLSNYPTIEKIEFEGRFPVAYLNYLDKKLPVKINLDAYAPFIPGDSKISSTPCAIFDFSITNPTSKTIEVSLMAMGRNFISKWCLGRYNKFSKTKSLNILQFKKQNALSSDYTNGTFMIAIPVECGRINVYPEWNLQSDCFVFDRKHAKIDCWDDFAKNGTVSISAHRRTKAKIGQSSFLSENVTLAGALCCKTQLSPKQKKLIRVIYSWYFPHPERSHIYQRSFKSSTDVADYANKMADEIKKRILRWHKKIFLLKAPPWLKDALINNLYPFISSSWWDKNNRFAICEAPCDISLMGTLDVRYYNSIPQAVLFPDLERLEMLEFAKAQRKDGYIPHDLGRWRIGLPSNGTTFYFWKDLNPKFIIMAYRDYLWQKGGQAPIFADISPAKNRGLPFLFLKRLYPNIKRAFSWMIRQDTNRDGLIENAGLDQTYDVWEFYGVTSYTAGIYLCSLLACEKIANILGDEVMAKRCKKLFKKGQKSYIEKLWNGKYFIACNGPNGRDNACTADQLNGQWYAHLLGLGYILPKDMVKRAVKTILSLNNKDSKYGVTNSLYGKNKRDYSSLQSKNIWPGTSYAFGCLAIYEGFKKEGLSIIKKTWENFSKHQKTPWDQPDLLGPDTGNFIFGDHYMRNMVIWAVLWRGNSPLFL